LACPLTLALGLRWDWTRRRWVPPLSLLLTLWLLPIIVITGSRGSLMAMMIVAPLLLMLRWPRLLYLLPLLLIALALDIYFTDANLLDLLSSGSATSGFDERVEIWQRALFAIQDFSFTGVGLGMFNRVIPLLYPYFLIAPDLDIPDAHNLLLQVGVDLGMPDQYCLH
jgi:putative inorganic carbon (HCO3(-)) transporter